MKSYVDYINERAQEGDKPADGGANIRTEHTNIQVEQRELFETDEARLARTGLSSTRLTDEQSKAVQKTRHRVSLDSILAKIVTKEFIYPAAIPHMTICVMILENGFALVGKSAPADAENFNEELGRKFAEEDAVRQAWPLEAYLLRERMTL